MLRLLCGVGEARTSFGINQFGVRRMHCLIGGAMENNGANAVNGSLAASSSLALAPLHSTRRALR